MLFQLFLFPLLALIGIAIALYYPPSLIDYKSWIIPLLMLVMLAMGLNLRLEDFRRALQQPKVILLGVGLQFFIMPLTAWLLAKGFAFSDELLIGMVLVGATAGGTASNVIAYLAKGDLALSVSMTIVSTLLAVLMLPLLSWVYLGQSIEVPVESMFTVLIKVIVIPILLGMLFAKFLCDEVILKIEPFTTLFAMFVIAFIIAIVVALNHANIADMAVWVVFAVMLHNLIGLLSGYFLSRWLGYDSKIARTVAIEVGMQNSGLSVALALKFYSPLSALPGAIFSIWHNLSGMLFALLWRLKK